MRRICNFILRNVCNIFIVFSILFLAGLFFVPENSTAAIRQTLNYQGKIVASDSIPPANDTYRMRFSLYDSLTGGNLLWQETWDNTNQGSSASYVTVTDGNFSVELNSLCGSFSSGGCISNGGVDFTTDSLYLSVEFDPGDDGTYEELFTPRKRLTATPYAFHALTAEHVSSTSNAFIQDGNSFGGTATLGTNDLNDLVLETNALERLRITSGGAIGIGTAGVPDTSAILEIDSSSSGLLIPRLTTVQRDGISSPATGLMIFNTDTNVFNFYDGSQWSEVGGGVGAGPLNVSSVQLRSTDTTTNINQATATQIPWDVTDFIDGATFTKVGNTVQVAEDGRYKVYANISMTSAAARPSVGVQIRVNGTPVSGEGLSGYIRNNGGHSDSSSSLSTYVNLTVGDTIDITGTQYANTGTVTMRNGQSVFIVERVVQGGGGVSGTGSAGQLTFWTGSSSVAGDTSLNWDNVNNALGIGTASPDTSSALEISSTTKGVLFPRMTEVQRDGISSPATGLMVYNTDTNAYNFYDGATWSAIGSGSGGGSGSGVSAIQLRSTDTTTNVNTTTPTQIPWNVTDFGDSDFTKVGNTIQVNADGRYKAYVNLANTGDTLRISVEAQFRVNGLPVDGQGLSGYIRASNGHSEASTTLTRYLELNNGDTIDVIGSREGNAGNAFMISGQSIFMVERMDGGVSGSGTTNSVAFWDSDSGISNNANFVWNNATGRLGVGTSTPAATLDVAADDAANYAAVFINDGNNENRYGVLIQAGMDDGGAGGETNTLMRWNDGDGDAVATLTFSNSAASFNNLSDERLKTNIADTQWGIETLNKIAIKDYEWKKSPNGVLHQGVIAQELHKIYPNAITVVPDDENEKLWMVDYSKLIPLIIKSVQDQQDMIEALGGDTGAIGDNSGYVGTAEYRDIQMRGSDYKANVIFAHDMLVIETLLVGGKIYASNDTVGQVTIKAGQKSADVEFDVPYAVPPHIVSTPMNFYSGDFIITNITEKGFTIQTRFDVLRSAVFNWIAMARHSVDWDSVREYEHVEIINLDIDQSTQQTDTEQNDFQVRAPSGVEVEPNDQDTPQQDVENDENSDSEEYPETAHDIADKSEETDTETETVDEESTDDDQSTQQTDTEQNDSQVRAPSGVEVEPNNQDTPQQDVENDENSDSEEDSETDQNLSDPDDGESEITEDNETDSEHIDENGMMETDPDPSDTEDNQDEIE